MRQFRNCSRHVRPRTAVRTRRCIHRIRVAGSPLTRPIRHPATPSICTRRRRSRYEQQPLLTSLDAQARAAREASVASAQLPDPQLFGGVRDLPIDTHDAYSISNDSDTQLVLGVSQEFPRAAKRKLRAEQRALEADRLADERRLAELSIRRDASFAWLDCWRAESARHIAAEMLDAAQLQADAVGDRRAVRCRNAVGLRVRTAERRALARRRRAKANRHRTKRAFGSSGGSARPRIDQWRSSRRNSRPVPTAAAVLERLPAHPELAVLEQRIDESHAGVELAEAGRLPDWRVEFGYGYRRDYSDMVMLQVGMDLPVFRGNRQNRDIASALATGEAAAAQWEDGKRRLESRALEAGHDLERINERLAAYDRTIEPQSNVGIEAATAAWRAGRGTLGQVIEARRVRLDVLLARLDLQYDALKRSIELDYLMGSE